MTNTVKHTPGPWEWQGCELYCTLQDAPYYGYGEVICPTVKCGQYCQGGSVALGISEADARLIAAAPDLLEALEELCSCDVLTQDLWDNARAAIAKAKGENHE